MLFLAILKRFRYYGLYTGPAWNATSLGTMDGASEIDCAQKCAFVEGCEGVKVTDAGGNGRKICTMYKQHDGINAVQESHPYVMGYKNDN